MKQINHINERKKGLISIVNLFIGMLKISTKMLFTCGIDVTTSWLLFNAPYSLLGDDALDAY